MCVRAFGSLEIGQYAASAGRVCCFKRCRAPRCVSLCSLADRVAVAVVVSLTHEVLPACTGLRRRRRLAAQLAVLAVDGSRNGLGDSLFFVCFLMRVDVWLGGALRVAGGVVHSAYFAVSVDGVTPVVAGMHAVVYARRAAKPSDGLAAVAVAAFAIRVRATREMLLLVVVLVDGTRCFRGGVSWLPEKR